jgi:glutaconate CoA-transferase subunit B
MTAESWNLNELLATRIARDLKDGELGFTGLATGSATALYATAIPLAAMTLARHLHAPNLTVLLAGWIFNPDLNSLNILPDAEFEETLRDVSCEAQAMAYPQQYSIRVFRSIASEISTRCASGIESTRKSGSSDQSSFLNTFPHSVVST